MSRPFWIFFNLLGSNVYFWFTKLLRISHNIVSIFSGVIIVTVNIKKMADVLHLTDVYVAPTPNF